MTTAAPAAVARTGGTAVATVLVAAVTLIFQLPFFNRWINFMDEGHLLQFADIIASGGDLYRDATVYPLPGAFYFLAGLFQIVEPSILLSRWIVTIQFTIFVTLCFVLVRRLVPLGYALGLVVMLLAYRIWAFPHWHMYSYSTSALLIFLVCMIVLLRFFETGKQAWLLAAGLIYGVGVAFKQDYGAAALVAFAIPMVVYARSSPDRDLGTAGVLMRFLGPAAAVGLCVGGYFASRGLLGDLLRFSVFNHFVGMASYEYMSFPSFWPLFAQDPQLRTDSGIASHMPAIVVTTDWQTVNDSYLYGQTAVIDLAVRLFYFGPYLLLAFGAWRLVRQRRELQDPAGRGAYMAELTIYCVALGLMALIGLNRPQDYVHMAVLYWPIFCLTTIYARALRVALPRTALAIFLAALVPTTAVGAYTVNLIQRLVDLHGTYFEHPRARIYTTEMQAENIGGLISHIEENTEPDERVAVMPYSPLIHFLADRDAPHRTSYIVWPFPEIDDRDRKIVEAMERHGTDLLVYDFVYFHDFPRVRDYAPELFTYLVENFEMDEVFTSDEWWPKKLAVARRKPEPTGGRPIEHDVAGVDVFIDSPDRPPFPVPPPERGRYVALDLWPFRPVMAIRPSAGGRETVVTVPVSVPPLARLETSVGVTPALWDKLLPSWVRFTLSVQGETDPDILFTKTIDPTSIVEDRAWFPVHVPLDKFAGRTIVLEFSVACQRERAETLFMGGWGMPRVVVPHTDEP